MNWYCIQTRPLKEWSAIRYCNDTLGVETYFPKLREQRIIRRVQRTTVRPLFPRYAFCRFDPAVHFRAIRYAPDVLDIVHSGPSPTVVQDTLIADLKSWAGDAVDVLTLQPALRDGDLVVVRDGPLSGLRAVVQHDMSDCDRVAVLLSILDCGARTVLPRSQLRLVETPRPSATAAPCWRAAAAALSVALCFALALNES